SEHFGGERARAGPGRESHRSRAQLEIQASNRTEWPTCANHCAHRGHLPAVLSRSLIGFASMPYEFSEQEPEAKTQASGAHRGGPPDKLTAVATLDPFLPREPVGQYPSALGRVVAAGFVVLLIAALI